MKSNTKPVPMVRQRALTNEEWTRLISEQAGRVKPLLNTLTLPQLSVIGSFLDDYGRHALFGYNVQYSSSTRIFSIAGIQGIYPPEDERFSINEFSYASDDIERKNPISVIQRFWGFTRSGKWVTVEVQSGITYTEEPPHVNRRWIPNLATVNFSELDDSFFTFVGLTPKQFWYLFTASIDALIEKRLESWREVLDVKKSILQVKSDLNRIRGGAKDFMS